MTAINYMKTKQICDSDTRLSAEDWLKELRSVDGGLAEQKQNFFWNLADALNGRRKALGMTQDQLRQLSGVGRQTIMRIESGSFTSEDGVNHGCRLSVLARLTKALDCTLVFRLHPWQSASGAYCALRFPEAAGSAAFIRGFVDSCLAFSKFTPGEVEGRMSALSALTNPRTAAQVEAPQSRAKSPLVSRLRRGKADTNIRLGTLFHLAAANEVTLEVDDTAKEAS